MPRSTRDSDDDSEPKIERVRLLATLAVNSPTLRRSSRIKQNTPSVSPSSDTSSVNNQSSQSQVRVTKQRAVIDSLDVPKEQRSRRNSTSSCVSETMDIATPTKRITRSTTATSSIPTPTKMNSRTSKRFVRAGSETKSPSPAVRSTRRTRSNSVEPESSTAETKSQPNTPIKVRKRASVLPANSPVKEEVEEQLIPYVRIEVTIPEIEEPTHSANSDSSPNKSSSSRQSQKVSEKRKSIDKHKTEKEEDHDKITSPALSDKTPELSDNNSEVHNNSTARKISDSSLRNLDSSVDKLPFPPLIQSTTETRRSMSKYKVQKDVQDKATLSSSSSSNEVFDLEKSELLNKSNSNVTTMDDKENLGDSNYLPDIATQSQISQKITKQRRSINKDNIERDDSLDQEKKLDQSRNKSEINNTSVDKTMHDKSSFDDGNNDALLGQSSYLYDVAEVPVDVIDLDDSIKSVDVQVSPSVNEKSTDQSTVKESTQNDETADVDRKEEEENVSEYVTELESSNVAQMVQPTSSVNMNKSVVQDNESSDFTNSAERLATEKESMKRDIKQTNINKSSDDLETKNNSHVLEKTQKDEEILIDDSDAESTIDVDTISEMAYEEEKKPIKEENNSAGKTSQELQTQEQEQDKEIETECDLILVDKKAWLAAKDMKMAMHEESSEYDSDDTVIQKSKLDAARANSDKNLSTINEEISIDMEMEVIDRESLHKSSNNTPLKQKDKTAEDVCMDECQIDRVVSQKESDTNAMEISQQRRSLSKSFNEDTMEERSKEKKKKSLSNRRDSKIEEQACLNSSKEAKVINLINDDSSDSDSGETHIPAMDLGFENFSTIANAGSPRRGFANDSDGSEKLYDTSDSNILPGFLFAKASTDEDGDNDTDNDTDKDSVDSDVRKEYNLDGVEQKFDDDDVSHDECRASESEYSDPNDHGSDLGDFIVDDEEEIAEIAENEKKEEEDKEQEQIYEEQEEMNDDDKQSEEEDSENEEEDKRVDTTDEEREKTSAKVNEYVMVTNEKSAKSQFSRKLSRLHSPMNCSTPKLTSLKHKVKANIETPKTVEETQESKVELDKSQLNTSSKKTKSKDSTTKKNTSLPEIFHQSKRSIQKPLNISFPSEFIKMTGTANLSKPTTVSKTPELYKSMRVAHTETPRIRHLRKEKLNESAPASKLHVEIDQSKDELPTTEEKEDVAETTIKEKNKENVFNLESSSDNIMEEKEDVAKTTMKEKNKENVPILEPSSDNITRKRKRQKKHKKQAEETLNENVIDKALSEDTVELEASRKKKRVKFSESLTVKDDICKDTTEINETKKEKKKKKKKLVNVSEQCENIKKVDTFQNDRNETELREHQQEQEVAQNEETSPEEASTKKRKRKEIQKKKQEAALVETKISKTKSKNPDSNKPQAQTDQSKTTELISAFAKARYDMQEAIRATEKRIKANQELKKKKMLEIKEKELQERALQLQKQERDTKISRKRKKEAAEERKAFAPSLAGCMERLPDDVIKNLSDVPTRATKRRRLLLQERPITPPQPQTSKSKTKKAKNFGVQLSSSGSTTQFTVINLQKLKKQPPKEAAAVASFRQRMLNRNEREPVSTYLMYREKQKASSNN